MSDAVYGPSVLQKAWRAFWVMQRLRDFNEALMLRYGILQEGDMSGDGMEKRGVVSGEGEQPAAEKEAGAKCCGGGCKRATGGDTMSRMADAVAEKTADQKK